MATHRIIPSTPHGGIIPIMGVAVITMAAVPAIKILEAVVVETATTCRRYREAHILRRHRAGREGVLLSRRHRIQTRHLTQIRHRTTATAATTPAEIIHPEKQHAADVREAR
jgi:hypothetical protein